MPGGGKEAATAGPHLEHLLESIADGASWQNGWTIEGVAKNMLTISKSIGVCVEAPAKKLAEHGDALQLELGEQTSNLHHSTRSVLKGNVKNDSRQYQRATRRFKLAMTFTFELSCFSFMC